MQDSQRRQALVRLTRMPQSEALYLAGGVAVAHHCGHRHSADLDLFTRGTSFDLPAFVRALESEGASDIDVSPTSARLMLASVPIDVMVYPYPLLGPTVSGPEGIPTAGTLDLAAMKLAAITHRAARRDFWDVQVLAECGPGLGGCVDAFIRRFGRSRASAYGLLKQLTSFDDAERGATLPAGMSPEAWSDIKGFFRREAPRVLRDWVG